ncbi:hypothetical protein Dsin_011605 [Dipteronia sinensis]|uniref:F-box domain-containing protein n=1 Tax=Dipteronia sinensis TaxID=43782 RepID=A0AAE0AHD5_9ROSI|nr:hypothetical protein Dsin_011605 [Dipteronia sinensis]
MLSTERTKTNSNMIITISTSSNHQLSSSLAETIANNDDLLTELFLCMPIKSLLIFKSVSKQWLSLITNPCFSYRRTPIPKSIVGLFVYNHLRSQQYDFINLTSSDLSDPPFQPLTFLNNSILQSCHGLMLLCSDNYCQLPINEVFNAIYGVNLAYDPSKSPHYKVIFVWSYENSEEGDFLIEIYSSKTGSWRKSISLHIMKLILDLGSLYFDVDEEKVHDLPMSDTIDVHYRRRFRYFGESRDHLHLIEIYGPCTALFYVYEMERHYSRWMVKYRVDLLAVAVAFPEMVRSHPLDIRKYGFLIHPVVREEEDEDSYFLVHIPNKPMRYNFKDKSFEKVHEFAPSNASKSLNVMIRIKPVKSEISRITNFNILMTRREMADHIESIIIKVIDDIFENLLKTWWVTRISRSGEEGNCVWRTVAWRRGQKNRRGEQRLGGKRSAPSAAVNGEERDEIDGKWESGFVNDDVGPKISLGRTQSDRIWASTGLRPK